MILSFFWGKGVVGEININDPKCGGFKMSNLDVDYMNGDYTPLYELYNGRKIYKHESNSLYVYFRENKTWY